MSRTQKIILIVIAILVVLLILMIGVYMSIPKKDESMYEYTPINEIEIEHDIKLVTDHNQYYSILNSITNYYMSIGKQELQKTYDILDKEYINSSDITNTNILEKVEQINVGEPFYKIQEMYVQDGYKIRAYYVHGNLKEDMFTTEGKDTYLIVYVDISNVSYSIYPTTKEAYTQLIKNGIKINDKEIKKNNNNKYNNMIINDETITTQLLYDYKSKTQNDVEGAYSRLDKEYKQKRFKNIEEYKKYIQFSEIEFAMLNKYQKTEGEGYTQYVCIDQNGNYYIFKETAVMDYTVILDTYTLDLPEFLQKYNGASEKEKILMDIQKIFEAINSGDYIYVYNKLDDTFKSNYFKTEAEFSKYISEKLYKKNKVSYGDYTKSQDVYMYDISIKNADNDKDERINKKLVMKLKEGTDFVFSFNVK